MPPYTDPLQRLMDRRVITSEGCWEWPTRMSTGYGLTTVRGKKWLTHRLAYTLLVGPIPPGYQVDHRCCNPPCFNPFHLDAVPPAVNYRRSGAGVLNGLRSSMKTHCPKGHPYDKANTRHKPSKDPRSRSGIKRVCRTCTKEGARRNYSSQKRRQKYFLKKAETS